MKKLLLGVFLTISAIQFSIAQDYRFGKISKEELSQEVHSMEPDASAAVLYRELKTSFNYDSQNGFTVKTYHHERIKIYNSDGYDYANKKIYTYVAGGVQENVTNLKASTFNLVNGKVEKTKLKKNGIFDESASKTRNVKKFTMPDIGDGSIVEFEYTVTSPFTTDIDTYVFQELIPVDKVEMLFLAPEYYNYSVHSKGNIPLNMKRETRNRELSFRYEQSSDVSSVGGGATGVKYKTSTQRLLENGYIVNLEDIPSLKQEPFSINMENLASSLQFELASTKFPNSPFRNYATTWEDVCDKIYRSDNFGGQLDKTNYYSDEVGELLDGPMDETGKINAIFNFVRDKMNWNEYYGVYSDNGVRKAYKEGVGNVADINLILVSMLREAGLDSNPVLLSTKQNGIPLFPTRVGFNYVIAQVTVDGKNVLLDAVDKLGMPNILKTNLLNWNGRLIRADGTSDWIRLYPESPAVQNTYMVMSLDENFSLLGNAKNRYSGHYVRGLRSGYKGIENEEQIEVMQGRYPSLEMTTLSFSDLDGLDDSITIEYDFEAEDAVDEIGDKLYISPLAHLALKENIFKSEERANPIDFIFAQDDRYSISIDIPEGYEVESIPEDTSFGLPEGIGLFKYNTSEALGKITVVVQSKINTPVIGAEYYSSLKEYFKLLVEKENEKIVLRKI